MLSRHQHARRSGQGCWRHRRPSITTIMAFLTLLFVVIKSKNQRDTVLLFQSKSSTYNTAAIDAANDQALLSSTQRHYLQQQQQQQQKTHSSSPSSSSSSYETKFVFVLGLEGTGHHFVSNIVEESPTYKYLQKIGIHPRLTRQLMSTLFQSGPFPNKGLISGTCPIGGGGGGGGGGGAPQVNLPTPNMTQLVLNFQKTLHSIHNEIETNVHKEQQQEQQQQQHGTLYYPVNVMKLETTSSISRPSDGVSSPTDTGAAGMLSYPNSGGPCRSLSYPNMDVILEACNNNNYMKKKIQDGGEAAASFSFSCQIVYLYRDPYYVLSSTIRRGYNSDKSLIEAIHLYTTQLHILYAQMSIVPPKTVIGCWNLYDHSISSSYGDWKQTMGPILGWMDDHDENDNGGGNKQPSTTRRSQLQDVYNKVYREPNPIPSKLYKQIGSQLETYMDSFIRIHNQVIQLCHDQVKYGQKNN